MSCSFFSNVEKKKEHLQLLPMLEKEYDFWRTQRAQSLYDDRINKTVKFFQYRASMKTPRPESYREDMLLAKDLATDG